MIFTVIAYKESGYQSYRNCITERFDSKFDSIMTNKKEDVIKFIVGKMSSESDHQEPDWDFMVCINGYVAYSSGTVEGTFSNIELDTDINDDYDMQAGVYNTLSPDKTNSQHLMNMTVDALDNIHIYPLDKLNRWLGFIQGVMTTRGQLSVDTERDFSRPLFHAAYKIMGESIPETKELK